MLDRSIPYYPIAMLKTDTAAYPEYSLPEGYSFVFYKKGDEYKWAEIEIEAGQFDSVEKGIASFTSSFIDGQRLKLEERMLFVVDDKGEYVATATLWDGDMLGEIFQRIHWVAVKDKCAGRGIAKALLSRLMKLYNDLGYADFIYLTTGTANYAAIGIYRRFGFTEYRGPISLIPGLTDEEYIAQTALAISMVNEKLSAIKK